MSYSLQKRLGVGLLVITLLAGCGQKDEDNNSNNNATEVTPATVKFMTSVPAPSFSGIYAAEKEGYFAAEKLTVENVFIEDQAAGAEQDPIELVLNGTADFGVAGADQLLTARQSGKPVVAIMAIYQRDPTAVISLVDKGIERPEDLVGKTIVYRNKGVIFDLFAQATGLDASQIIFLEDIDLGAAIGMFMQGEVDGVISSATDTGVGLQSMGVEINTLMFYDYGVAMYPNLIFTTDSMIEENPGVVQRFTNAVLKGTQYAVDNPAEMVTWFETTYPDSAILRQVGSISGSMDAIIPLLHPQDSAVGMMSPVTWTTLHDAMVQAGFLAADDTTQAYTMQFLDVYYKE